MRYVLHIKYNFNFHTKPDEVDLEHIKNTIEHKGILYPHDLEMVLEEVADEPATKEYACIHCGRPTDYPPDYSRDCEEVKNDR